MISGAKYWYDRDRCYFSQENNPTEQILKKREEEGFLESCGPSAACSALSSLGYDLTIRCPGSYSPQPEEVLMDFFNDPRNYDKLEAIRRGVDPALMPGNRVPQWYPYAVKEVFGATGAFFWTNGLGAVAKYLEKGYAVQLCLKKPGHYIAAVAYDNEANEIIFNDSYPGRFADRNGFNRHMDAEEFKRNVKSYAIIYSKEDA